MRAVRVGRLTRAEQRSGLNGLSERDVGQVRDVLGHETADPALRRVYPSVRTTVESASAAQ
jgi:hypothetical protein